MLVVRRAAPQAELDALVAAARVAEPTSPTELQGRSLGGPMPAGWRQVVVDRVIGRGDEAFDRAADGVLTWRQHIGAGARILPDGAPVEPGTSVVALLPVPLVPLAIAAPCRVVAVVDDDDHVGFAYDTLPGHPVMGEESFVVRRGPRDSVWCRVAAFSRPVDVLTRIGAPVTGLVQRSMSQRYVAALERVATGTS